MNADREAEAISTSYQQFIDQCLEKGEVWGLKSEEGWCVSPSADEEEGDGKAEEKDEDDMEGSVMPFWSTKEGATACATEEWDIYKAEAIPLQSFLEEWLPGLIEDGLLVGINWSADLTGIEVDPADLQEDVLDTLEADEEDLEEEGTASEDNEAEPKA